MAEDRRPSSTTTVALDLSESAAGEEDPGAALELAQCFAGQAGGLQGASPSAVSGAEAAAATTGAADDSCRACSGSGILNGGVCPECEGAGTLTAGGAA